MFVGAVVLADALINLANQDDLAADMVERLSSDLQELIKKVKRKITGLKRRKTFIHWQESARFTKKIAAILTDMEAADHDPGIGLKLMTAFYETDRIIFNNCDDSSGHIGTEYTVTALDMFTKYASVNISEYSVQSNPVNSVQSNPRESVQLFWMYFSSFNEFWRQRQRY